MLVIIIRLDYLVVVVKELGRLEELNDSVSENFFFGGWINKFNDLTNSISVIFLFVIKVKYSGKEIFCLFYS